jgi:hypothetical protein
MFSTYQRCGLLMMLVHHPSISWLAICLIFTDQIRQLAIEKLSDGFGLDPIEKILLAKKYRVRNWLLEGYAQLIGQQTPLQTKPLDLLDCKTKVSLLSLRDRYPPAVYGDTQSNDHEGSPTMVLCNKCKSKNHGGLDKLKVLGETFTAELADMS